jgi:glycosyltransferase involved in cell wall biosynthesis
MACGCACVEVNTESVRAMVRDGVDCLLAEPAPGAVLTALLRLIDDKRLRDLISRSAYAFAKELNEEQMCGHFERHVVDTWMLGRAEVRRA